MSEKQQRTAASMREKMLNRYGTEHHKHNKNHNPYRLHSRTYPIEIHIPLEMDEINASSAMPKKINSRKTRKRLDKGRYH